MTPTRRAEIEKLLEKYNRGYFYNINIDARAAIRDALAEIDRLNEVAFSKAQAEQITSMVMAQMKMETQRYTQQVNGIFRNSGYRSDHRPDHEPDLDDEREVEQHVPPPRV